jgi:hypothetical protein
VVNYFTRQQFRATSRCPLSFTVRYILLSGFLQRRYLYQTFIDPGGSSMANTKPATDTVILITNNGMGQADET